MTLARPGSFLRRLAAAPLLGAAVLALASGAASGAELTVSAAASLTNALREIGVAYERTHPETRVLLNFGASGSLLQQLAQGAPVDVFASADEQTMDEAQRRGLVAADSRVDFARNSLVVVVPRDASVVPRSLADLAGASIRRIAIGVPASVPAGRYAKTALAQAGHWTALEGRDGRRAVGAAGARLRRPRRGRGRLRLRQRRRADAGSGRGRLRRCRPIRPSATRPPASPRAGAAPPRAASSPT